MDVLIIAGVAGGIAGGCAVLLITLLMRLPNCPDCGEKVPRFRLPTSTRQAMWGGWTCANCGCEMDRKGRRRGDA